MRRSAVSKVICPSFLQTALTVGIVAIGASGAAWADDERPVKIGVLGDHSSPLANLGGPALAEAVRMAVEDFGGVVLGKKIEITTADNQAKTDIGATIARRWFDIENVDVITDVTGSAIAFAVMELSRDKKKNVLVTASGSSDITGAKCSPYTTHWNYDTYALAQTAGSSLASKGEKWFYITVDYAFGHSVEKDSISAVTRAGAKVVGATRAPLDTHDFSSYLLTAQASGADIIALANAGGNLHNNMKQAAEFGLTERGQKLVPLVAFIDDIHALGLNSTQGVRFATAFYWDASGKSRGFSQRFFERTKRMPNQNMAATYDAVTHYLRAVQAVQTKDAEKVAAKMREMPVGGLLNNAYVRKDGRVVYDMYVVETKKTEDSKSGWDLLRVTDVVPGAKAFRPVESGGCPLVK
ncbi:ABC transporter substrate-binding protein [Microvirga makkahensis]|uniref:ABC transporter substrate-binding protein n=1 Tax=Microvirga makkahensis TaxID=1128670 RepID=A0A7X3SRI7_9HYPH|nr:ABC transporter substrate-binding protein [Microvirga makkahensis]MXQ14691.1 ABC transporter substrate-binding protein [Microvirga makkahensis]